MHNGSMACVRVNRSLNEWVFISVGVRQECVMFLWLFNAYMDGVMRGQSKNL